MGCVKSTAAQPAAGAVQLQPEQQQKQAEGTVLGEQPQQKVEQKPVQQPPAEQAQKPAEEQQKEVEQKPAQEVVVAEEQKLATVKVQIVSARGLRCADVAGKSDPFCIVEVVGKPATASKTAVSAGAEPLWNHSAEVAGYKAGDALVFTVKDKDMLQDDLLGTATVAAELVKSGFEGELKLEKAGEGVEAFVVVKIEATEPALLEEVKEAIVEKVVAGKEAMAEAGQKAKELAVEAKEAVEHAVHSAKAQIEDESKAVTCMC